MNRATYPITSKSAAAEASRTVATPCELGSVIAWNGTGADAYLLVFDSAILPANGTVPDLPPVKVTSDSTGSFDFRGILMRNGVSVCFSTTAATKTIVAGATNMFHLSLR